MQITDFLGDIGGDLLPGLGSILGAISGVLGGILGGGGGSTAQIQAALSTIGQQVVNGIQILGTALEGLIGIIGDFVKRIWDALKGLIGAIGTAIKDLQGILQWLRNLQDWLFRTFIGPILNVIQMVRSWLVLLRVLHVKFAVQLDQTLASIEGQIVGKFESVWTQVNQITSWAQLITNQTGALSSIPLVGGILQNLGVLQGYFGPGAQGTMDPAIQTQMQVDVSYFDSSAVNARMASWAGGKTPADWGAMQQNVQQQMTNINQA